ncbi:MAG TPA: ABC transporter ATP-binding protein [Candidatus Margulisiibacteriota bacterium]|nr:ABC transporter ATP-binding protein [Candidatus Margulisiibacteriota bacterium]
MRGASAARQRVAAGAPARASGTSDEAALGKAYDARLIRRLWAYIRPYRRDFWLAMACLPATSVFVLAQPYILKIAIDRYINRGNTHGVALMGGVYAVAMVGEFTFMCLQYYLTMLVAQKSLADLRIDIFAHVQRLEAAFFDRNPVGRLVTRMTTDVDVINEMFAAGAITILMDIVTLLGIVAIMLAIDWRLAVVSLSLLPLMGVAINFFRLKARHSYRLIRERIARINAYLQEAISGMMVIQLFGREEQTFREFDQYNDAHREANHWSNIYEASLFSLVEAVSSISFALIVWYGGGQILAGALAFGTLVAFIEYVQKFFIPLRDFSSKYAVMQSAMSAAERVFELLDTVPAVRNPAVPRAPAVSVARRGRIEFDHVWFAYKTDNWVLRDVSFTLEPGEKIAIVGATGAGKTTIIKLLNRFYDVQRGHVRVDGIDVRDWDLETLRRCIGAVAQDVFLFSGTIADNISLRRSDTDLDAIRRAATAVNAHRFIARLPARYEEPLRERGSNLSAGQRQLLSFARALAYDPTILVLDEATSSVDTETELLIQDALETLMQDRTAVVIAHRLSTIERSDRIIVMHHGAIREMGTHQELLELGGLYARLHALQTRGREHVPAHVPPAAQAAAK